jgi:ubiquinone/menaquinone biosynthesis C-methylase UbiE
MYGKYWYRSGTNSTMKTQLNDVVNSCLSVMPKIKSGLWLDIACNDGTLLSYVPNSFKKLGIDPADESYTLESSKVADEIIQNYFTLDNFNKSKFRDNKCNIITCISMFYDLEQPKVFLDDVYEVLDDDGLFVIQMSYTPLMVEQTAFDNICHEHYMYYSLHSLNYYLKESKFKIVDCEINNVNGGSFRVYIQKDVAKINSYADAPHRDVANFRTQAIFNYEDKIGANTKEFYINFYNRVLLLKNNVYNFIKGERENGKTVWVYGASTKGNTLLQYFNLDDTLISGAAERSQYKYGLKTVGTNITIFSEDDMRKANPDYLLILPWHFIHEFCEREYTYLNNGGKFIVPCPTFEIIQK